MPCDSKKTINIACLPCIIGGIDIALDSSALQSPIIQGTVNGQNITYIQCIPEPCKVVFEHSYDFCVSHLPTWNLDSVGCMRSNINHLFELRVFKHLDRLEKKCQS